MLQPRPVVLQGMQVRRVPLEMPEVSSVGCKKKNKKWQDYLTLRQVSFLFSYSFFFFNSFVVWSGSRVSTRVAGKHSDDRREKQTQTVLSLLGAPWEVAEGSIWSTGSAGLVGQVRDLKETSSTSITSILRWLLMSLCHLFVLIDTSRHVQRSWCRHSFTVKWSVLLHTHNTGVSAWTVFEVFPSPLCVQEPSCRWERVCRGAGQSGGLPGVPSPAPGLLQGHLGVPVLPGHRQLPVLFTEGTPCHHSDGQGWIWKAVVLNFPPFFSYREKILVFNAVDLKKKKKTEQNRVPFLLRSEVQGFHLWHVYSYFHLNYWGKNFYHLNTCFSSFLEDIKSQQSGGNKKEITLQFSVFCCYLSSATPPCLFLFYVEITLNHCFLFSPQSVQPDAASPMHVSCLLPSV